MLDRLSQWITGPQPPVVPPIPTMQEPLPPPVPPPSDSPPPLKGPLFAFNHIQDFAIENDHLFYQTEEHGWRNIACPVIPERVKSDGALLMISNGPHLLYKRTLMEYPDPDTQEYRHLDIAAEDTWIRDYFELHPNELRLPFQETSVPLPEGWLDWSCSHRGLFSHQVQDGIGQLHSHMPTSTCFYLLLGNGKHILLMDPFVPAKTPLMIALPETSTSTFEAVALDCSASTLMVLGYECVYDPIKQGTNKTAKLLTMQVDYQTVGQNDLLPYAYPAVASPERFVLPMPNWKEHPFPLNGYGRLTSRISIFQAGPSVADRELRVAGVNETGALGYYHKRISDGHWEFTRDSQFSLNSSLIPTEIFLPLTPLLTDTHDYHQGIVTRWRVPEEDVTAKLLNFGPLGRQGKLLLIRNEQQLELSLVPRPTSSLEEEAHYDLLLPKEELPEAFARWLPEWLGSRSHAHLMARREEDGVRLCSTSPLHRLSLKFKRL